MRFYINTDLFTLFTIVYGLNLLYILRAVSIEKTTLAPSDHQKNFGMNDFSISTGTGTSFVTSINLYIVSTFSGNFVSCSSCTGLFRNSPFRVLVLVSRKEREIATEFSITKVSNSGTTSRIVSTGTFTYIVVSLYSTICSMRVLSFCTVFIGTSFTVAQLHANARINNEAHFFILL